MIPMLEGLPQKHFRCVLADCPWAFKSHAASKNPKSDRHVERHYKTMKIADIQALPIKDLCHADGAHLFLWATGPNLPQALVVMTAWGFRYSGIGFVWIKLRKAFDAHQLRVLPSADGDFHVGLGFTTRKNAEFCLLGRRGNARRISKKVRELILSPRREHSRKPEEARQRIEEYCEGPYLDLFAREERAGWTVRGDQVGKFA